MTSEIEIGLTIVGSQEDIASLSALLQKQAIPYREKNLPAKAGVLPFTFESLIALVIALGSGGIVAAVAKCIVAYLKERKRKLIIQTGDGRFEIVSENFSPKELESILASLPKQSVGLVARDRNVGDRKK